MPAAARRQPRALRALVPSSTTNPPPSHLYQIAYRELRQLCRLQRKLKQDECNGVIQWDDDNAPYAGPHGCPTRGPVIPDRESRWLAAAREIAEQCGGHIYHQGDPRGCQLYFYRDSDLEGRSYPISQIYSTAALACC